MNQSTLDRRRVRACVQIAAEMNRAGEGALDALESLRVEAPELAARVELL